MLIKLIVGYSVFNGTQSIGMVALVVSSMGTIEDIISRIFSLRKDYLRFRFQESSILLFLDMCEPIGSKDPKLGTIDTISLEKVVFSYPNLKSFEVKYMQIAKEFMK
jgi:ABC-type bacteriocin/lantibiotic exporter with double-glycine peptidase domain